MNVKIRFFGAFLVLLAIQEFSANTCTHWKKRMEKFGGKTNTWLFRVSVSASKLRVILKSTFLVRQFWYRFSLETFHFQTPFVRKNKIGFLINSHIGLFLAKVKSVEIHSKNGDLKKFGFGLTHKYGALALTLRYFQK